MQRQQSIRKQLREYIREEKESKKLLVVLAFLVILFIGVIGGVVAYQFTEFREMKHVLQALGAGQKNLSSFGDGTVGYYNPVTQNIQILGKDRDPYYVYQTCIHELGHYIDYEHLKLYRSKKYNKTFMSTDEFVSSYAQTNIREYFAETFMTAMEGCINMSKIPEDQHKYFKDILIYFPECI
jgi:hypothetical protein